MTGAASKHKGLWRVERCFREAKSLSRMRPVDHRRDETILLHAFCSLLVLLLKQELGRRMREAGVAAESADVVRDLAGCRRPWWICGAIASGSARRHSGRWRGSCGSRDCGPNRGCSTGPKVLILRATSMCATSRFGCHAANSLVTAVRSSGLLPLGLPRWAEVGVKIVPSQCMMVRSSAACGSTIQAWNPVA